ncbi:Aldehyde reductase 2 [Paramyrothecium foliicola]|nr:Aldehyde reductase 2 [Paramyrothecium foliicola]
MVRASINANTYTTMSTEINTAIPKDSWVLITGATGFVASQLVRQFLERGYKVRGTVRDLEAASWLTEGIFKPYVDQDRLELALVPDLATEHAFDDAVKGVSAIAHVASVVTFDADPNKVIPQTVAGVSTILEAAIKEPLVREVVFTSSILAATFVAPAINTQVGKDTWNDAAVEQAWAPPPYEPARGFLVYAASKVQAEKELWKFVDERKPHFNVNVIAPSGIIGEPLHEKHSKSVAAWVTLLYHGDLPQLLPVPAAYFVDVKDIALLHLAAILDPDVKGARFHAWGHNANWNDMLPILRKLRPKREFIPDFPTSEHLAMSTDQDDCVALLNKWAGQTSWRSLEEIIEDNISNPFHV